MPVKGPSGGYHRTDLSVYMTNLGRAALLMALDHYFHDVIEGNVPLEDLDASGGAWCHLKVVPERVNRFNANWCVLFEALAQVKANALDQSPEVVRADANLNWATKVRRETDWKPLTWQAEEGDD
jgi:hypothetical protein